MSGFSGDSAWGATAGRRRRRHVVVEPAVPDDRVRYTATVVLTRQSSTDAATVAGAREVLTATVEAYARPRGLLVVQGLFHTDPPEDATATATVKMRLEAELLPRIDGEWPAIHAAIREDEADRAAALVAKTTVDDRLDALATAAGYWSARSPAELREALSGPIPQATDTV